MNPPNIIAKGIKIPTFPAVVSSGNAGIPRIYPKVNMAVIVPKIIEIAGCNLIINPLYFRINFSQLFIFL